MIVDGFCFYSKNVKSSILKWIILFSFSDLIIFTCPQHRKCDNEWQNLSVIRLQESQPQQSYWWEWNSLCTHRITEWSLVEDRPAGDLLDHLCHYLQQKVSYRWCCPEWCWDPNWELTGEKRHCQQEVCLHLSMFDIINQLPACVINIVRSSSCLQL